MKTHQFVLRVPANPLEGSLTLDGLPLQGVVRAFFEWKANGPSVINLTIMGEVLIEGEFRESAILVVDQAHPGCHGL